MSSKEDLQFLALLVHRGHLSRAQAEGLLPQLKSSAPLDALLQDALGWDEQHVARLRRTHGGELPELPGFTILGRLGAGGTSDVFRAREKKTGTMLALKVLKPDCTRHAPTRQAFIAEARLLERLNHPGLVRGQGIARSGNVYFSKLELIDGHTLIELLDEGQAFEESAALRIVLSVAEVLAYLSEQGVVHRDIKPGNIMLSSSGVVKLIDLGFAAEGEGVPGPEDSAVGTVAYLSPEAASGGATADLRSDIYSLGVTLFHVTVGRLPFESSDDREVLRMQIMESLSSPELKGRGFSPHLQYFIEKMMAKDKAVRYQSWGELQDDVRSQLSGRDSLDFRGDSTASGLRRRGSPRRR